MSAESPDITALGATASPGRPQLERLCAIRAEIGTPTEFDTSRGHGSAFFPITGGVALAARWRAEIVPGGADFARRLQDGSYEVEARYLLQLEDGTSILVRNSGRMVSQPDGSYHGRTHAELEVPSGPHEALADMVLFGTAFSPADAPEHVFIELWHAAI